MCEVLARLKAAYGDLVRVESSGSHWAVWVPEEAFEKMSLLEKHRHVKKQLQDYFDSGKVHALQVHIVEKG